MEKFRFVSFTFNLLHIQFFFQRFLQGGKILTQFFSFRWRTTNEKFLYKFSSDSRHRRQRAWQEVNTKKMLQLGKVEKRVRSVGGKRYVWSLRVLSYCLFMQMQLFASFSLNFHFEINKKRKKMQSRNNLLLLKSWTSSRSRHADNNKL